MNKIHVQRLSLLENVSLIGFGSRLADIDYLGVFSGGSLVSGSTESNLGSGTDFSGCHDAPSVSYNWGSPQGLQCPGLFWGGLPGCPWCVGHLASTFLKILLDANG